MDDARVIRPLQCAFVASALLVPVLSGAAVPSLASAGAATPATSFHVVAAKKPIVDSQGRGWQPDAGYASGGTVTTSSAQLTNTASPALYRSQRSGVNSYAFPVSAAGTYSVVLYVAELNNRNPGQRVYDVTAEGSRVVTHVDVAASAGKNMAWHVIFTTAVTDGVLNVGFVRSVDKPIVSAVAVEFVRSATLPTVTFADEFNDEGAVQPNATRWHQDVMPGQNQELNMFTDQNAYTDGSGSMVITARREDTTTLGGAYRAYTSGRISTKGTFSYTYGTAEARILTPAGQGLWPTWWAMGTTSTWPASGEIDAMEQVGQQPATDFGTAHGATTSGAHWQYVRTTTSSGGLAGAWHNYAWTWVPGAVATLVDGRAFMTVTPADLPAADVWPFDKPFYLLLDLAVGGTFPGSPSASTVFPAEMKIDWVRVTQ